MFAKLALLGGKANHWYNNQTLWRYIRSGRDEDAVKLYQGSVKLQHDTQPSQSLGEKYHNNTLLHFVVERALVGMLREFLEHGGNPNVRNDAGESALHRLMRIPIDCTGPQEDARLLCMAMLLDWKGPIASDQESVNVTALDSSGNSVLHLAAKAGMLRCAQRILRLPGGREQLFVQNKVRLTACELAGAAGHAQLCSQLECLMVFGKHEGDGSMGGIEDYNQLQMLGELKLEQQGDHEGLSTQQVQEQKDMLLVQVSEFLSVPLFTAEALLRQHRWRKAPCCSAYLSNPSEACAEAGVAAPESAPPPASFDRPSDPAYDDFNGYTGAVEPTAASTDPPFGVIDPAQVVVGTPAEASGSADAAEPRQCGICFDDIGAPADTLSGASSADGSTSAPVVVEPCAASHSFCEECWRGYLKNKVEGGKTQQIICPAFECALLVPLVQVEGLLPREMRERYHEFDVRAFVDSNCRIKWCPAPGCNRAVLSNIDAESDQLTNIDCNASATAGVESKQEEDDGGEDEEETERMLGKARMVGCGGDGSGARTKSNGGEGDGSSGGGHFWCWRCHGDPHSPCDCEGWVKWRSTVGTMGSKAGEAARATGISGEGGEGEGEGEGEDDGGAAATAAAEAADALWLIQNTKRCPKCNCNIEKNDGCNHMTCRKCGHGFCWMCMEEWTKHGRATGGYYKCNRFDAIKAADVKNDDAQGEAKRLQRFVHYYVRYGEHDRSRRNEEKLLQEGRMNAKLEQLQAAFVSLPFELATRPDGGIHRANSGGSDDGADTARMAVGLGQGGDTNELGAAFLHDAASELLQSRFVLRNSYAEGYYLSMEVDGADGEDENGGAGSSSGGASGVSGGDAGGGTHEQMYGARDDGGRSRWFKRNKKRAAGGASGKKRRRKRDAEAKQLFELMQGELEECTEALSAMIARNSGCVVTPRGYIVRAAVACARQRKSFVTAARRQREEDIPTPSSSKFPFSTSWLDSSSADSSSSASSSSASNDRGGQNSLGLGGALLGGGNWVARHLQQLSSWSSTLASPPSSPPLIPPSASSFNPYNAPSGGSSSGGSLGGNSSTTSTTTTTTSNSTSTSTSTSSCWRCSACTFDNPHGNTRCEVCSSDRGDILAAAAPAPAPAADDDRSNMLAATSDIAASLGLVDGGSMWGLEDASSGRSSGHSQPAMPPAPPPQQGGVASGADAVLVCPACTLHNPPGLRECQVCSADLSGVQSSSNAPAPAPQATYPPQAFEPPTYPSGYVLSHESPANNPSAAYGSNAAYGLDASASGGSVSWEWEQRGGMFDQAGWCAFSVENSAEMEEAHQCKRTSVLVYEGSRLVQQ
jgi:ankyrin repeat/IBR domain-containing protein 1